MPIGHVFTDNMPMGHKDFYLRVRKKAKEQNTTIKAAAMAADLTISSYDSYKRRENYPRADEAVRIAEFLDTSVEYLVTGKFSPLDLPRERKKLFDELTEIEIKIREFKKKL